MKLCALVTRVSTGEQARNPEGSLTNQLQNLREHIKARNSYSKEEWKEIELYELRGISGKDSIDCKDFQRLHYDIQTGKINTILCTELDRISRSVKAFINFMEFININKVEFVCIKQNFDTTTPQGSAFLTILVTFAQYEREMGVKRAKEATLARAERGRWNGGHLLGYDLDPNNKGNLIPNEKEKVLINFAFDTYLRYGSIPQTAKLMNRQGYRTKAYQSRREKTHPSHEFGWTSVQLILTNYAYIGYKEINKKKRFKIQECLPECERYKLMKAVWDPIVNKSKFDEVQELIKKNHKANHNVAKPIKHNYIFNGSLLWCEKCGSEMEGGSGTAANHSRYYYYICKNTACRFRISAIEIEKTILEQIKKLSLQKNVISTIVDSTNLKLHKELPQLKENMVELEKELAKVKDSCSGIVNGWLNQVSIETKKILNEQLEILAKRRNDIETGIQALKNQIGDIQHEVIDQKQVIQALNKFNDVFYQIQPYKQKELIRLLLYKAVLSNDTIKLALFGNLPEEGLTYLNPNLTHAPSYQPGSSGRTRTSNQPVNSRLLYH